MTLERCRLAYAAEPGSAPRRLALARALLAAGEAREALGLLDEETEDLDERTLLAVALVRLDRTRRAERLLSDVLAADPLHAEALRHLAELRLERGAPEQAIDLLERLRRVAPDDGAGRALLGRAERRLGLHASALRTLEASVTIDPYNGEAYLELARLWESLGQWERAHESWELAGELAGLPADEIARHLAECARKSAISGERSPR